MAGGQKKKKQSKSADYPKSKATKDRYDRFCQAYHANGNNGAEAARQAGYAEKTARQTAAQLLTIPYIQEKLDQLKAEATEEYKITVEQRLKWLERVVEEGFEKHIDAQLNKRALGLNNAVSAIKEMNLMLGTTIQEQAPSLNVQFSVSEARSDVQVTRGHAKP